MGAGAKELGARERGSRAAGERGSWGGGSGGAWGQGSQGAWELGSEGAGGAREQGAVGVGTRSKRVNLPSPPAPHHPCSKPPPWPGDERRNLEPILLVRLAEVCNQLPLFVPTSDDDVESETQE